MVILLNGSINAGKSTVARCIKNMGLGIAHIEVDELREFIRWMPLLESIPISLANVISVASNFHRNGIDSIVTMPLNVDDYAFLAEQFGVLNIPICAITLYPGMEQLKRNRGQRELTEWELNRIDELEKQGYVTPPFGHLLANETLSVEQTAEQVLNIAGVVR